jgi:hypothetical protein
MAMQTFNDELDDLPTSTPAPAAHTAAAAAPAPTPTPKATPSVAAAVDDEDENPAAPVVEDNESLDTDFDDEKVFARPGQLNQCRPEKGKAKRFAFVPKEWIAPQTAKGHFLELPGKDGKVLKQRVRCLTAMGGDAAQGYCCKTLGKDGEVNVVALVISYTNADPTTGKYEKDSKVEFAIEFVRLSQFNMRQIKKLPDEDKTPFDIDLVMTHADRAFGYEFNRKANSPRWKSDPQVEAAVKAAVSRFLDGKALRSKLGTKHNEIEWKSLLSGKKVGAETKIENVDEL